MYRKLCLLIFSLSYAIANNLTSQGALVGNKGLPDNNLSLISPQEQESITKTISHIVKREKNMDSPALEEMKQYATEAFLANHIYLVDQNSEVGNHFQYGKNKSAELLYYENASDLKSGFTAGIYKTNEGKLVVSFGGTKAKAQEDGALADIGDFLADLNLLNNHKTHEQVKSVKPFMEKVKELSKEHNIDANNISITGHSLGGGLAQYANLLEGYNTVTFNTAPIPLSADSVKDLPKNNQFSQPTLVSSDTAHSVFKYGKNIKNVMTENDPLTAVLEVIESYEKSGNNQSKRFEDLIIELKEHKLYKAVQSKKLDSIVKFLPKSLKSKVRMGLNGLYLAAGSNIENKNLKEKMKSSIAFMNALHALEKKDMNQFIQHMKVAYNIPKQKKINKLIYGDRIILPIKTRHSMEGLINASFNNTNDFQPLQAKQIEVTDQHTIPILNGTPITKTVPQLNSNTLSNNDIIKKQSKPVIYKKTNSIIIKNSNIKAKTEIGKKVIVKNSNLGTEIKGKKVLIKNSTVKSNTRVGKNAKIINSNLGNKISGKSVKIKNSKIVSNTKIAKGVKVQNTNLGNKIKGSVSNTNIISNVQLKRGTTVKNSDLGITVGD